jgi:hypothetical protein
MPHKIFRYIALTGRSTIKAQDNNHPRGAGLTAKVAYRTVKIDGLDIFYREAGPKGAPACSCSTASRPVRTCSVT